MSEKHTPGPWTFSKDSEGVRNIIAAGNPLMHDEPYYPEAPKHDPDWYLIAAAPDLLKALQRVKHDLENPEKDIASNRHAISMATRQFIIEAVAKAEGQQ